MPCSSLDAAPTCITIVCLHVWVARAEDGFSDVKITLFPTKLRHVRHKSTYELNGSQNSACSSEKAFPAS